MLKKYIQRLKLLILFKVKKKKYIQTERIEFTKESGKDCDEQLYERLVDCHNEHKKRALDAGYKVVWVYVPRKEFKQYEKSKEQNSSETLKINAKIYYTM